MSNHRGHGSEGAPDRPDARLPGGPAVSCPQDVPVLRGEGTQEAVHEDTLRKHVEELSALSCFCAGSVVWGTPAFCFYKL